MNFVAGLRTYDLQKHSNRKMSMRFSRGAALRNSAPSVE